MGRFLLLALLVLVVGLTSALLWQHLRYLHIRRDVVHDQQPILHSADAFHVVSYLELAPGDDVIEAVRGLRDALGADGAAKMVYAGKVAANVLASSQLVETFGEAVPFAAVVVLQYPSREAYDRLAASEAYEQALARFPRSHSHGMQRGPWLNMAIPFGLLGLRAHQIATGAPAHLPFEPAPTEDLPPEAAVRTAQFAAERELGAQAVVIVNLLRRGTPEQVAADRAYGLRMLGLMAEGVHGPMHMGRAVALEHDAAFDQVALVYYPGVDYLTDMVRSRFFQDIVGDKQPGDTQASVTVPILHLL